MTKAKMIETIQNLESELWLELAEYDLENAPKDGNYDNEIKWDLEDPGHNQKLTAWFTISTLLETLDIPRADNVNNKIAFELSTELFRERQRARGITY